MALETVFGHIAQHARKSPDKAAVIAGEETISYLTLARRVAAVANGLVASGVKPGDRIGVSTNHSIDHLVGEIGAMAAGAIPVALPSADKESYAAIVEDAEPSVIIGGRGALDRDGSQTGAIKTQDIESLTAAADSVSLDILDRKVRPDEIAMIYYTSGTSSGIRKGVMQSYLALHNTADYIVDTMKLTGEAREFVASSLDNAYWFGRCRTVLKVGGTLLLHIGTLNPLGIIDALKRNDGNSLSGDTPVFLLLINHIEKNVRQIAPSIRWVKIASQAMPLKDKKRMLEVFPNARIVMGYGLTEAMRTTLLCFNDFPEKLATDGPPCRGVLLSVVDGEGKPVPANTMGDVLIGGANLASGYWKKEAMWRERFDGKWYKSGDLGHLDEDGFLVLAGRKDDAINSGGKTIALSEVENRIRPHIEATSFAVCGMSDPKGVLGDVIALCVEGPWKEKKDWKHLRIHLFECMEPAFVPKEAFSVPSFPRTTNGKVQLRLLRERIEAGQYEKM